MSDSCNVSSRDERDQLLIQRLSSSSCLKDICCENRSTCCISEIFQTANSAALASGHRKKETGSIKLTGTHNLLKHFTPQHDDKWCKICRTKEHFTAQCVGAAYSRANCYSMGLKNTMCISLCLHERSTGGNNKMCLAAIMHTVLYEFPSFKNISIKMLPSRED